MKVKISYLILFFIIAFSTYSQTSFIANKEIQWRGLETWSAPGATKQVIAFAGASYPSDNDLPYWIETFEKEGNILYDFKVENPVFEPATEQEVGFLAGKDIPEEILITSFISQSRSTSYVNVQVLPLVKRENSIFKLTAFELQTSRLPAPRKALTANHSYAEQSVLRTGKFIKIKIRETGIYKLTYEALSGMGIEPANVRVFGYGGALLSQDFTQFKFDDLPEVAVWMEKGADGVFNAGDYILFFGQGIVQWQYDKGRKTFKHSLNHYSTDGYYFVTSDVGTGKKIQEKTITVPADSEIVTVNEFWDYQVHEIDRVNLGKTGKIFYGEEFYTTLNYNIPFTFPNMTGTDFTAQMDVAAVSSLPSSFEVRLNNADAKKIYVAQNSDKYDVNRSAIATYVYPLPEKESLNFSLTYTKGDVVSRGYLNYISVNVRRKLQMTGSVMFFRNPERINTPAYNKFILSGANSNVQIWDITDHTNPARMNVMRNGDVIEFIDSNEQLKQYVAIDPTAKTNLTLEPTSAGAVPNQDLHALPSADMVIITHPDFVPQAERLAAAHLEKDNLKTHVVTTEQVYNEFSSGTPDASAYRWVMKMFYDRAKAAGTPDAMPKYLLLFGRGSFDNRGIVNNSGDNLVLTYQADVSDNMVQSYVTDDYFGFMDDYEGTNISSDVVDLGIGRFPTVTVQHAEDVVNKIIGYMNNEIKGNWKNQLAFLAEDGDNGLHIKQADRLVTLLSQKNPFLQYHKIFLDAFPQETTATGESYPLAKKKLHDLLNSGLFMLNYTGHANLNGWTSEQILSSAEVRDMHNKKLPIWVAATCDFLLFDTNNISGGEHVLLNPFGGGVAILAAARIVYADRNEIINRHFSTYLLQKRGGTYPRLGDAMIYAKKMTGPEVNKLSYMLIGDPALQLTYPADYNVVTTKINGKGIQSNDTLKALSVNTIEGYIEKINGEKATEFNGVVEITLYDKEQKLTTLKNSGTYAEVNIAYPYTDRPNTLYMGKARVSDGLFSFTFMMPKDIRYNYGTGRINYYAADTVSGKEGHGYYENFIIGGSSSSTYNDGEGPKITLYFNNPDFESGDKVNETPVIYARISDERGINTAGVGIGHDLRIVLDDNPSSSYIVNEHFETDINTFKSGQLRMKLPEIAEGKHTLTLHAWDLLNNSSRKTIEFEVVKGLSPTIFSINNYPNPVKTSTTFAIEHDRPETILEARIDIFDLTGRLIFTRTQHATDHITWNIQDAAGNRVRPGMYIYNVSVKTNNSKFTSKANKIIVLEQ